MRLGLYHTKKSSPKCVLVLLVSSVCALLAYKWINTVDEHCWEHDRILVLSESKRADSGYNIAIGCAITSAGMKPDDILYTTSDFRENSVSSLMFFQQLLPSFCKTASVGFTYRFYLAYDFNDKWFNHGRVRQSFNNIFRRKVKSMCASDAGRIVVDFIFVRCNHNDAPAWAQNDAMLAAYHDDIYMHYYYRLTDDTVLLTANWTYYFIQVLNQLYPPNVGVVGPTALHESLLAFDFVHRTHIDIFNFYYPRQFRNWYADRWITHVYQSRTVRLGHVAVNHTRELKVRYTITKQSKKFLNDLIIKGSYSVKKWLRRLSRLGNSTSSPKTN